MTIKVIGAGLGRTGTASFKRAMDILELGPCYHMEEVFGKPEHIAFWKAAGEGRLGDFEEVFAGYQSSCDWPSARWYREQADLYPDAKVVLTLRDPDSWFRSTQDTIFAERMGEAPPEMAPFIAMVGKVVYEPLGDARHDRDKAVAFFHRHNDEVRRTIPAERLLEFDAKDGWAPLCAFLGVPVPDVAYPRVNTTEQFLEQTKAMRAGHAPNLAAS